MKQDQSIIPLNGIVNIYIVYEITNNFNISDYPTLENCLFGAVNIDKYGYSDYGIGFNRHGSFSFPNTGLGRNVIVFGVDMSSSINIDNRKKDILIPGKGLEHTLSAEKMYSINFTEKNKNLCLSLHYNGANSYLFVNDTAVIKFK